MKEEITNIIRTFEAVGPILGNAMKSGQLFEPQCELSERDPDVLCEYDVRIPMSEGFSVTANIFRSKKAAEASPDDMALFIAVNKLDKDGKPVHFNGSVGIDWDMVTRGWCKVSRRELDPVVSTEWHPVQEGTSEQKWQAGEIVSVDVELYPSSTFFAAGEALQLIVAGDEIIPSPPYKKSAESNHGLHVLHFGGEYDSYLLVPKVPSQKA